MPTEPKLAPRAAPPEQAPAPAPVPEQGGAGPLQKPKKKRRALRIVGGILAAPVILGGLGLAYLHTGTGKARVRSVIEARLGERVDGEVKVGTVDYALFGDIHIGDVHIKDPAGAEVVGLSSLTISPSWSDLVRGRIVLDRVDLSGVIVHVVKDADGGSNLKRLLRPQPPAPEKKPFNKRIEIKVLSIGNVGADILQPDGARIVVSGVGVEGGLALVPADKTVDVEIGKIVLDVAVDRGAGGLKLGVTGLQTGLTVKLDRGLGKATLHPLKGHVAVTLPEQPERGFDLGLEGFSADIGEAGLGVSLDKLLAGAVALASVEVKGRMTDGNLDGKQDADVIGLKLSGQKINDFLGREVLIGDIDIDTHVHGPPDKIEINSKITTLGATVAVDGAVGIADPASPSFDVAVAVTDVDTDKVLAAGLGIDKVSVERVEVSVKGQGQKLDSAGATGKLKITGVTSRGVRIDGIELTGTLEKGVLKVQSLQAKGLGQQVTAKGEVELATRRIDLTIGIEGDVGDVLGRLKAAGLPIKSALPRGAVRLAAGDFQVRARGLLGGTIDVEASAQKMAVFGGTVALDARASLIRHDPPLENGKKVTVTAMDGGLRIGGIKLSHILAMRGKKLPAGMEATLSGEAHVSGSPTSPRAKVELGLVTSRDDKGKTVRLALTGDVTSSSADLRASLVPTAEPGELFGLRAKLPLTFGDQKKGLDPYRPIEVHAELPKRKLSELWEYVPKSVLPGIDALPPGDVSLSLDLGGTAAKPDGKLHTTLTAKALFDYDGMQKVDLDVTLHPAASGLVAQAKVDFWANLAKPRFVHLTSDVDLSRSPVLGPAEVAHRTTVLVGPSLLSDLPIVSDDVKAMGATLQALASVKGNKEDLTGTVTAAVSGARPTGLGQAGVDLAAVLGDDHTDVDLKVRVADTADGPVRTDLLRLSGKVGLGGKKLYATLKDKEHLDPSLALVLDIPRRALASLAVLRPNLAKAPGNLSGSIPIRGTAKLPLAKGAIALDDIERVDGKMGGVGVALEVGKDEISALIGAGLADATQAPLQIAIRAPREEALKMRRKDSSSGSDPSLGTVLPVSATIRAKAVDLRALVPAFLMVDTRVGVTGTLDWNMDVKAELTKQKKGPELTSGSVTGLLDLHGGAISLPGTRRAYHDVALLLKADEKGLHLDALRARESDLEVKDRAITVKGDVGLDKLKPTAVALSVAADKWLVFGPRPLGFADAPRGTLSLDVSATAELTAPIKHASIRVNKLDLAVPERFERAHQPEDVQAGDLVFLNEGKTKLGKLAVPASVADKALPRKAEPTAGKDGKPLEESGFDIDVHVAEGARLWQAPIDLSPKGDLHVKIRPDGRKVSGALTMTKGRLALGGQAHALEKGSLSFDEKNPAGYLDLYFAREMRASALRGISEASAGKALRIHIFGAISERTTVLSGAGSPGALWDVLSMHTVGRERFVSEPDLPESIAIDFPQHENLLVLSFLSVNLPHLLFLDRFAVWADPYDDARAYGKLTHFEAERFLAGDSMRVRATARPRAAGQSEAEVGIDYLFVNEPRMLFGVGVTGGTRGGGGPGVVWQWSSRD